MTLEGFLQDIKGSSISWAGLLNSNSFKLKEREVNKSPWYLFTCSISLSCITLLQYLTLSASWYNGGVKSGKSKRQTWDRAPDLVYTMFSLTEKGRVFYLWKVKLMLVFYCKTMVETRSNILTPNLSFAIRNVSGKALMTTAKSPTCWKDCVVSLQQSF